MAYKVFTNGSVLNASELNENLMQQSIAVFSNAAARTAAITSPVEGQTTYLQDSNRYESYSGSAWEQVVTPTAWVAYTPTTSGLTLGNGTIAAFYSRVGRMVTVRIRFILGSTSAMGSFPNFSLPFTPADYSLGTSIVGLARHFDVSADFQAYGRARLLSGTATDAVIDTVSGSRITVGYVNSTTPFTWAVNDVHELQLTYEAA